MASSRVSPKATIRPAHQRVQVVRDVHVLATAWQEDDPQAVQRAVAERSVVIEPAMPAYDPFEEDDRLAQLPDDPFDEPMEESIPVPEPADVPEESLEAIEDAVEEEIKRRQSVDDLLGEESEELLESDPLQEDNPLEDSFDSDLFGDDPDDEEMFQLDKDDWKAPDFVPERDREDPSTDDEGDDVELTPEEMEERLEELAKERKESEESCREELAKLESDRISSIDLSIRVEGNAGEDYPFECAISSDRHQPRQWPQITYNWKAAALCHKPLYFEQVQLERYGHSWGPYVQPIMSGAHFFGTLPDFALQNGHSHSLRMRLHARLLSTRQLCTVHDRSDSIHLARGSV